MRLANFSTLLLLGGMAFSLGCSSAEQPGAVTEATAKAGSSSAAQAESDSDAATEQPAGDDFRKVPTTSLPATQGTSPTLDGGRLKVPLLPKWIVPPRTSEWLFRLQRDKKTPYPQILVTVNEGFEPQLEKLSKSNVSSFVPVWQKQVDKTHAAKSIGEQVSAVRIGKRFGVECLIHSVAGKISLEQLMVTMIGAGRVYTFELRAQSGTLEEYRMDFYAVIAGTTIELPATTPGGFEPMKEDPAEDAADEAAPKAEPPASAADTKKK